MDRFKKEIIVRNLSISKFEKYNNNNMANTLQIINDQDTEMFEVDNQNYLSNSGPWLCVLSYVLWVFSLVGWFAACTGPHLFFLCFAASAYLIRATYTVITDCEGLM